MSSKLDRLSKKSAWANEVLKKNKNDMRAMLIDKDNAVPFLKMLEDIAAATGNEIRISVVDLSKMKSQASKNTVVQESDDQSTKDIQKEDQAKKTPQTKNSKPDFSNQLGFSIELSGGYDSLIDFFTKLENMPYFVQAYNFQIIPVTQHQAGVVGAASTPDASGSQPVGAEEESKNIKSMITIGVYTNGSK